MTPSGIEPATFRLVRQCLNQLRHLVHHKSHKKWPVIEPQSLRQQINHYLPKTQKQLYFDRFVSWKFRDLKSNGEVVLYGKATDVVRRL